MIKKDLLEHFDYIGRLTTTEFYRECKYCKTAIRDTAPAMGAHLKHFHPKYHKNWTEYLTK